ncbi:unnamed protein product, partial [Meganyctiphanes norvegica]
FGILFQVPKMWYMQLLTICLLVVAVKARQLEVPDTHDEYEKPPLSDEVIDPILEMEGLSENDLDHEESEEIEDYDDDDHDDDDLGELVPNEVYELEEFSDEMLDVSDMPVVDGRSCFTAWEQLKEVEPEAQILMTQDPKINPIKPLKSQTEEELPGDFNQITNMEFEPENFRPAKTPCYRSLNPGNDTEVEEGDAGYCECKRYTVWNDSRFCCPQCAVFPQLTARDNMFKCACIFESYITSEY